jgi:hypothetical protein
MIKKGPDFSGPFFTLNYFFLKPVGQEGFNPLTFLVVLPLTQVIVTFLGAGLALAVEPA